MSVLMDDGFLMDVAKGGWYQLGFNLQVASLQAIIFIILLSASFFHGLTGFGFSLIAMPLLALVMNLKDASNLVLLFIVVNSILGCYPLRGHFDWRWKWDYVLGIVVGVFVGVYILVDMDEAMLRRILGGLLLAISINEICFSSKPFMKWVAKSGFLMAVLAGVMGGAFNLGAPPSVLYAYSQSWKKEVMMVQLQLIFLTSSLLRVVLVGVSGIFDMHLLFLFLACLIPVILGSFGGQKMVHYIPEKRIRGFTFVFLGLLGLKLAVWG